MQQALRSLQPVGMSLKRTCWNLVAQMPSLSWRMPISMPQLRQLHAHVSEYRPELHRRQAFIVVEDVARTFEQKFVEATTKLHVGDPLDRATQIGPMARGDLRDTLHQQVRASIAMGAHVLLGGKPRDGKGYYYEPTIITDVTPDMPIFREETFGPVAAVIHARDAEHALELANDSDFGLGGNLWTTNIEQARKLARRIESGGVFINGMTASIHACPLEASNAAAMDANSLRSAFANSSISRPSGLDQS